MDKEAGMVSHHFSYYGTHLPINRDKKGPFMYVYTRALYPSRSPSLLLHFSDLGVGAFPLESTLIETYFIGHTALVISSHPNRSQESPTIASKFILVFIFKQFTI